MKYRTMICTTCLLLSHIMLIPSISHAGETRLAVSGDQILLDDQPIKILGLRCSNALISDASAADLGIN